MKTATIKELEQELGLRSPVELLHLCIRLSRFKKENKEYLTYLLFESIDEAGYIAGVKSQIDIQFEEINRKSPYFFKKSIRKILNNTKKYARYSKQKQTGIDLLIYFCLKFGKISPSIHKNKALHNLYIRQVDDIIKKVGLLHEDLQFDYRTELEKLHVAGK